MLRESSWKPCVKIIPEYQDNSIYCDAERPPVQLVIVVNCSLAINLCLVVSGKRFPILRAGLSEAFCRSRSRETSGTVIAHFRILTNPATPRYYPREV